MLHSIRVLCYGVRISSGLPCNIRIYIYIYIRYMATFVLNSDLSRTFRNSSRAVCIWHFTISCSDLINVIIKYLVSTSKNTVWLLFTKTHFLMAFRKIIDVYFRNGSRNRLHIHHVNRTRFFLTLKSNFCVVLCIVCFVTYSVFFLCICVLNYCHRVATQLQLNISYIYIYIYIYMCVCVCVCKFKMFCKMNNSCVANIPDQTKLVVTMTQDDEILFRNLKRSRETPFFVRFSSNTRNNLSSHKFNYS
jgi:hypothetical protein